MRRLAAAGIACGLAVAGVARADDPLFDSFVAPPADARPLVFWQWVNGNVTEEGIKLDLQWMQRVGLAGALMFDIGFRTPPVPQYVEKRVGFGTPEWSSAVRVAGAEARRLGLVLGAQSSGGWSVSGGPEVPPQDAMKKLVWSETVADSRSPRPLILSRPPSVSGPYQDVPIEDRFAEPTRYGDVAVVAFRLPDAGVARLDRAAEKAGFSPPPSGQSEAGGTTGVAIDARDIVELTSRLATDGTLDWQPPSGRWCVLRFGWSLTGRRTVPATPESIGLEVDKLDAAAVRRFASSFFGRYRRAMGSTGSLGILFTDSWEAGQQNWTPAMLAEFRKRRGYDLRPWLPVLTGRIVGDAGQSERVLADFRRTISDLLVDSHYGALAEVAHAHGMALYSEAPGTGRPTIIDGLAAKGRVDVPMGEYWYYPSRATPQTEYVEDVREAASAAHIYGKRIVAAEALATRGEDPWATGPRELRRIVDRYFAEGVNRLVLHTSPHQPFTDVRPGITLRQYGQHFTRNETWAEDAGAWTTYLARTSQLLQQGRPVADVAVFVGDDVPFDTGATPRPDGYDFDLLNAEVLLRSSVRAGSLMLESGAKYRVLVHPPDSKIVSDAVRQKLRLLATAKLPMVEDLREVAAALRAQGVAPDVESPGGAAVHWAHRATETADIYFVTNQGEVPVAGVASFRVKDRHAEAWNAVKGTRASLRYSSDGDLSRVKLELGPYESRFIVFRGSLRAAVDEPGPSETLAKLDDVWDVEFLDFETPKYALLPGLVSWTESENSVIRYYSGRARYQRELSVPEHWLNAKRRIVLDLGVVADLARVFVNGRDLGVSWTEPDRIDITSALQAGSNRLEIIVTNYWANRMIGDRQPGAMRVTFAPIEPYTAASPLRPSGLLGPVTIVSEVD